MSRRKKRVYNYAYPIVEAVERSICGMEPFEEWNGTFLVTGENGEPEPRVLGKTIDIDDIEYLYFLEWADTAEKFYNYEQLICDALERSAYDLGYEWSNESQSFVRVEDAA